MSDRISYILMFIIGIIGWIVTDTFFYVGFFAFTTGAGFAFMLDHLSTVCKK